MIRVLNVLGEWTKLLDAGISIDVLYTDFQKAFDTVPLSFVDQTNFVWI